MKKTNLKYYFEHDLYSFFENQISNIKNEDKFFSGNFISNENIKIFFTEPLISWIKNYKHELVEIVKNIYDQKKQTLDFDKYLVVFYFYFWILDDLRSFATFVPIKTNRILNIGAGVGLLDVLLNAALNPVKHCMIEIKKSSEQIDIDGTLNTFKEEIFPYDLLKENLDIYQLKNIHVNCPDALYLQGTFDLVVSIRSWCFLYPPEVYFDYIDSVCNDKTIFICDVHRNYHDVFSKNFETVKLVKSLKFYSRLVFKRK